MTPELSPCDELRAPDTPLFAAPDTPLFASAPAFEPQRLDKITLRVTPVDGDSKLPWLASAELPRCRAASIAELRRHVECAVEAGNLSAIQKLKRRRETRKRAKRGEHCRLELFERPEEYGGGCCVRAYAMNAAGAGAALRSMIVATASFLSCGRSFLAFSLEEDSEQLANLGWAELSASSAAF